MAKSSRANPVGVTRTNRRVEPTAPPTWVKPQLAKLVDKAPDGPDWLHELKLDGYRMHARLDGGGVQILTRRGNDWTDKYPAIAKSIAGLPARNAYLDGELCGVLPMAGQPSTLSRTRPTLVKDRWSSSFSTCCT
jgi:ATP-dependent DNA ligase